MIQLIDINVLIRSLNINKSSSLASYSSLWGFREPRMGFEDNIRMKKIINEQLESNKQKYSALELKTHEKGFIENFYNILNINQKVSLENYCILYL